MRRVRPDASGDVLPRGDHLAFHAGDRAAVGAINEAAPAHGWVLLVPERHPRAGGPDHCAAYLEDADGGEAELVASKPSG